MWKQEGGLGFVEEQEDDRPLPEVEDLFFFVFNEGWLLLEEVSLLLEDEREDLLYRGGA